MTWDAAIWAFAGFDVACLIGLAWAGLRLARQAGHAARTLAPAIGHARRTATLSRSMASAAADSARTSAECARRLAELVQRRVATTRRIAAEIRPPVPVAPRQLARDVGQGIEKGRRLADRLRRLHRAGSRAAGRDGPGAESPPQ